MAAQVSKSTSSSAIIPFVMDAKEIEKKRNKDGTTSSLVAKQQESKKNKKSKLISLKQNFKENKSVLTKDELGPKLLQHFTKLDEDGKTKALQFALKFYGISISKEELQNQKSAFEKGGESFSSSPFSSSSKNSGTSDNSSNGGSLVKRSGGNIFYIIGRFLKADVNGSQDEMVAALKQVAAQRNLYSMMNSGLEATAKNIETQTAKSVAAAEKYQAAKHESVWDKIGHFFKSTFTNPVTICTFVAVVVVVVGVGILTDGAGDAALAPEIMAETGEMAEAADAAGTAADASGDAVASTSDASSDAAGAEAEGGSGGGDGTNPASGDSLGSSDAASDEAAAEGEDAASGVEDGVGDTDDVDGDDETEESEKAKSEKATKEAEANEEEATKSDEKTKSKLTKMREKFAEFKKSKFYRFGLRPLGYGLAVAGGVHEVFYAPQASNVQDDPNFIQAQGNLKKDQVQTEILSNKIGNIDNNINQTEQTQINNPNQQMQAAANSISQEIGQMTRVESIGQG